MRERYEKEKTKKLQKDLQSLESQQLKIIQDLIDDNNNTLLNLLNDTEFPFFLSQTSGSICMYGPLVGEAEGKAVYYDPVDKFCKYLDTFDSMDFMSVLDYDLFPNLYQAIKDSSNYRDRYNKYLENLINNKQAQLKDIK